MIRFWEKRDVIQLLHLVTDFLVDQNQHGMHIRICEENIQWYLRIGFEQASHGQPHLVYEENGRILAYIQMGECLYPLQLEEKTAEIFSMFTVPESRRRFLSIELVRAAAEKIAALGFKRIYSTVFLNNERMIQNMTYNPAIWPMSVRMEWNIQDDPQFEETKLVRLTKRVK